MSRVIALALVLGLLGAWSGQADARYGRLAGSWFAEVTPLESDEVPVAPPPFASILNFGLAGTLVETDTSVNPNTVVDFFPPEEFPAFTASDGYGSWKRTGPNRFIGSFIKFLFDVTGMPIGLIITTLDLVVTHGRVEGEGTSDFVRGTDPEGEVFFSGDVVLEGARLKVQDR